ncbi:long-chain-fatty-acid--CoA ligase 5 [Strongylocentrotus purpuratus]|uniref:Long-chain-fatty-acid--CoA ligase n=1 Tax=Strongylocentrotus purpuratus TaxID=7668 RepID=A0A7M7NGM9_STRPU|nr:long-chain-fatty-acid--CoA ligase 5 [Strongylocentrotus purpuratus]
MSRSPILLYALRHSGKHAAVPTALKHLPRRAASSGVTAFKTRPEGNTVDLTQQSIVLPGPEKIRVASYMNEACYKPSQFFSEVSTVYEAFKRGQKVSNDGNFLGARTGPNRSYEWMSYSQAEEKARLLGSGLMAHGNQPGSCVGIFSQNRPEWTISDLACVHYSMISVPLYNSLGWKSCRYIVNKTLMSTLIVDTVEKATSIIDHADAMPSLRVVVVMDLPDEGTSDLRQRYTAQGIELCTFEEVLRHGAQKQADLVLPSPNDINTICFTSGTTGLPKGVPLKHKNHIANHSAIFATYQDSEMMDHADVHLSLLPCPHVYERGNIYNVMTMGLQVGFFSGDILKLIDDAQELKPTIFAAVPRLYNRLFDRIRTTVDSGSTIKKAIFNHALNQKMKDLEQGTLSRDTVWDKLVFKKVQEILGGRLRYMYTGGAPISGEVITFLRCVFGCSFVQAYGQTETTSCMTHTLPSDTTNGHIGPPGGGVEIKLIDVPELDYYADNNQGEICVKAANVFEGYLDNPELTAEALDEDGWVHSGDIGEWTETGTLKLIDRKKHIFKMSQGVYIAPEKIENTLVRNPLIQQVFVYGDSTKANLVGIVVPDPESFPAFAAKSGVKGSLREICQDKKAKDALLARLQEYGRRKDLLGFEEMKDIRLHDEPFSEQNGLLTPSLKNKRPDIAKEFEEEIRDMYTTLD